MLKKNRRSIFEVFRESTASAEGPGPGCDAWPQSETPLDLKDRSPNPAWIQNCRNLQAVYCIFISQTNPSPLWWKSDCSRVSAATAAASWRVDTLQSPYCRKEMWSIALTRTRKMNIRDELTRKADLRRGTTMSRNRVFWIGASWEVVVLNSMESIAEEQENKLKGKKEIKKKVPLWRQLCFFSFWHACLHFSYERGQM